MSTLYLEHDVRGVSGYGFLTPLITLITTVTGYVFQERATAEAERSARHERARVAAAADAERARQAAAAKAYAESQQVQAAIAAGATGGAVAVDAHGNVLPASGVSAGVFGRGGINPMLVVGIVGIAGVGLLLLTRRK